MPRTRAGEQRLQKNIDAKKTGRNPGHRVPGHRVLPLGCRGHIHWEARLPRTQPLSLHVRLEVHSRSHQLTEGTEVVNVCTQTLSLF